MLFSKTLLSAYDIILMFHSRKGDDMEKEYVPGKPRRYQIGKRVFIVEPYYKNGESMEDILLKLMMADMDEKMWNETHK